METSHPFALALKFYFDFKRSKLTTTDLNKIHKKYGLTPEKLLADLQQKYSSFIPEKLSLYEALRICSTYPVPKEYMNLILPSQLTSQLVEYSPKLDVQSEQFDAAVAIQQKMVIAANPGIPPFDNLSKAKHLVPGITGPLPCHGVLKEVVVTQKEKKIHLFQQIAALSTEATDSPLLFIFKLMKERSRVRILIRKHRSARGSIEAYVKAFDKHFNMLLTDADEEYTISKSLCKKLNRSSRTVKRHLSQVMIRGDNVILIGRCYPRGSFR